MDAVGATIALSLALLTLALAVLAVRGLRAYLGGAPATQAMWGSGLALASAAMAIETVVYVGIVSVPILQAYVFLSAALVGVLSLGCTPILGRALLARAYTAYIAVACAVVAVGSFLTPLPLSMVSGGIIAGDPPAILLILSTLVTGPATVVLLGAAAISLRRSRRWQTMLMIAGALVLGAGGTLYIASFPVFLYYAEFLGIVLLFAGLVSLSKLSASQAALHETPSGA